MKLLRLSLSKNFLLLLKIETVIIYVRYEFKFRPAPECIDGRLRKGRLLHMISTIAPLSPLREAAPSEQVQDTAANGFGDIFKTAIDAVKESDAEKTQLQYLQATGQLDNPVYLNMASSKYELSVSLLVQLRNRALDAYNELIRISL